MALERLPYLCAGSTPIAGAYKQRAEDFRVFEIPAYEPCGEGTHVFFEVEKRGVSTSEAVRRFARALGVGPRAIGYAGLKDARAITRQTFSVEHVDPERLLAIESDALRVLSARPHVNKLRVGHLAGNRFEIRLRDVGAEDRGAAQVVLETLARRGVPNYFGEQRFGVRGDSWRIGRALLLDQHGEAAAWLAGRPSDVDHGRVKRARELFDAGDFHAAARTWPGNFRDQIRLSTAMGKKSGDAKRALHAVDRQLLRLALSAYQSRLFNQVVAARIGELERLQAGDLAWKHDNGAVFEVVDAEREQPRADSFELSPSGPLFGRRTKLAEGVPGELERRVLAEAGHTLEDFGKRGALEWQGARRPLRFPLREWSVASAADEHGPFLELRFALPPGCYATSVLREMLQRESDGLDGAP